MKTNAYLVCAPVETIEEYVDCYPRYEVYMMSEIIAAESEEDAADMFVDLVTSHGGNIDPSEVGVRLLESTVTLPRGVVLDNEYLQDKANKAFMQWLCEDGECV